MRRYLDIQGTEHDRPAGAPVEWRVGGYALVERDGRLLMVETVLPSRWKWDLPGGGIHLEPEETILEGIVREVREETGHRFTPDPATLTLVDDSFFRPPSGRFWRMVTFVVRGSVDDSPAAGWIAPSNEISQIAWIDPATLHRGTIIDAQWELLSNLGYVKDDDR